MPKVTKSRFRINAKNLFLTYPQCPIPLSAASKLIKNLFEGRLTYAIVSQEDHADDGGLHLHAAIVMNKRWDITNPRALDLNIDGHSYHGRYESMQSLYHSIKYVCKDGKYVGINCDAKEMLKAAQKKTSTKAAWVVGQLMMGKSLKEINVEHPTYVMLHLKKLEDYQNWLNNIKVLDSPKLTFDGCLPWDRETEGPPRTWDIRISQWLNSNFLNARNHRQPQLWVHGPTSTGKTHLLMQLSNYFHGFHVCNDDGKWVDGFSDDYDYAYLDEFKGSKTIQWLNGFVEGSPFPCPQRGKRPYIKQKNMPVIVCANYSIQSCYSKADPIVVAALKTRFLEVEIPSGERIEIAFELDDSDEDTAEFLPEDLLAAPTITASEQNPPLLIHPEEPEEGPCPLITPDIPNSYD